MKSSKAKKDIRIKGVKKWMMKEDQGLCFGCSFSVEGSVEDILQLEKMHSRLCIGCDYNIVIRDHNPWDFLNAIPWLNILLELSDFAQLINLILP